jgi:hypothetical protein
VDRIGRYWDNLDRLPIVQPDQMIAGSDVVFFADLGWNDRLTSFGNGSLHSLASFLGFYKMFSRNASQRTILRYQKG